MVEIEKPRIKCIENPGDVSYGKYVVEPLERGYGTNPHFYCCKIYACTPGCFLYADFIFQTIQNQLDLFFR